MNVEILEKTFALIRPNATQFTHSFYQNLFQEYPETQKMFAKVEIAEQEKKLLTSLVVIIENLRNLAYLKNLLKNLGQRHVTYNVVVENYQMVGNVLLKTLEFYLNQTWTSEVKQAWTEAYQLIIDIMLEGAKEQHFNIVFQGGIKKNIAWMRIKAIAQKAWLESGSTELVFQKLMEDVFFQEIQEKIGKEKALQLLSSYITDLIN